jgi:hypothetical protein
VGDVLAVSAGRGVVDVQVGDGLAGRGIAAAGLQDQRADDMHHQVRREGLQTPGGSIEELVIDRPMPVGQLAQRAKDARDRGRPAMQHPAQGDLLPDRRRRLSEDASKLLNQSSPCRYKRRSIHADSPVRLRDNNPIGKSATFLSVAISRYAFERWLKPTVATRLKPTSQNEEKMLLTPGFCLLLPAERL